MTHPLPLLILGGTGRIGQALRVHSDAFHAADMRPIWQSRKPREGCLAWDILGEPCPDQAASGIVLCLAGVIRGDADALAQNEALARAAYRAAADQGARHVFLASSAAVYGPSSAALSEQTEVAPLGAYGQAKLAMEQAALGWQGEADPGLTILRIGNIAGFDALLGGLRPGQIAQLDPIAGQEGGPVRSYIGPKTLGAVLAQLAGLVVAGSPLPQILNIATAPPVRMCDLLDAAGADWRYGVPNPAVLGKVELDVGLLTGLVELPPQAGQPAVMVAEWRDLLK